MKTVNYVLEVVMRILFKKLPLIAAVTAAALSASQTTAYASSHREAPFITETPKVDGTDVYMFAATRVSAADM